MAGLRAELPNWSTAATATLYVVDGCRPPRVAVVPDTCATCVPSWKMRYWTVQPAPAVAAFHERLALVVVCDGEPRPVGTEGAAPQPAPVTVMPTAAEVVLAPELSVATAVSVYEPAGTWRRVTLYGAVVSAPREAAPWRN